MSSPDDLRALGIDRAELRWEAVCGFLDELRDGSRRAVRHRVVLALATGFAEDSAKLRGESGWISRGDLLSAVARIRSIFGDAAAEVVSKAFVPSSWRAS